MSKIYKSISRDVVRTMLRVESAKARWHLLGFKSNMPEIVLSNALIHQTAMRLKAEFERDNQLGKQPNQNLNYWHNLAKEQLTNYSA